MTQPKKCSTCGTVLPPDAPAGICPKCLLQAGMNDFAEVASDDPTLLTDQAFNVKRPDEPLTDIDDPRSGSALPPGTKLRYFGDYELLDEIARGGMGVVYKARQLRLNRTVALKMILAGQFAGPANVQRFQAEAEAAAQLDHPGIVPIFEVGEHDGHHFFSMGLVEGDSLASRISRGPLDPGEAAEIVRRIADAVQYAHENGVIHRDLKPGNVLIDCDGSPRLTDFGLAKSVEADSCLTTTGQVLGTPGYMPPEQALGRTDQVSELSDVYSLGAILYASLTGRPPFQSANLMDTLNQVAADEPVSPRDLNRQVPRDLATITLMCLSKAPAQRYSSAAALSNDLSRWLRGEPITARPVGVAERSLKFVRRRPLVASLLATVVISVLAGLLVSSRYAIIAQNQASLARTRESEAQKERDKYQSQLWESLLQQSQLARLSNQRWQAIDAVQDASRLKGGPRVRQAAIEALFSSGCRLVHQFSIGNVDSCRFSPDSRHIAIVGNYQSEVGGMSQSNVGVWNLSTGERVAIHRTFPFPWVNHFRPHTNDILVLSEEKKVELWDPLSAAPQERRDNHPFQVGPMGYDDAAVFSPEGNLIAIGVGNRLVLRRLDSGEHVAEREHATPLEFSGSDSLVVRLNRPPYGIVGWKYRSGEDVSIATGRGVASKVSTDGSIVAVLDENKLTIRNARTGETEAVLAGETLSTIRAHFSTQGHLLAFQDGDDRNLIRVWDWRADVQSIPLTGLSGIYADTFEVASFSPDGSLFAAQGGNQTVKVWEIETGKIIHMQRDASNPVWSPDGRYLATSAYGTIELGDGAASSGPDKVVTVWEVASLSKTYRRHGSERVDAIRFRPDGKRLAAGRVWGVEKLTHASALWLEPLNDNVPFDDVRFDNGGVSWTLRQRRDGDFKPARDENQLNVVTVFNTPSDLKFDVPVKGRIGAYDLAPANLLLAVAADIRRWTDSDNADPTLRGEALRSRRFQVGNAVEVWDLRGQRQLWREEYWRMDQRPCLTLGPFGKLIAVARMNFGIEILSAKTGEQLHEVRFQGGFAPDGPQCLLFSGDGKHLFAADGRTGTIVAIDCSTGVKVNRWPGHPGGTSALTLFEEDDLIASGGRDGLIRLWSLTGQEELAKWDTGYDRITALAFSPDGEILVSATFEGVLQVWSFREMQAGLRSLGLDWQ